MKGNWPIEGRGGKWPGPGGGTGGKNLGGTNPYGIGRWGIGLTSEGGPLLSTFFQCSPVAGALGFAGLR